MIDDEARTPFRAIRQTTTLSLNEVARRVQRMPGMERFNAGRLSMIERGLIPTQEEKDAIMAVLMQEVAK